MKFYFLLLHNFYLFIFCQRKQILTGAALWLATNELWLSGAFPKTDIQIHSEKSDNFDDEPQTVCQALIRCTIGYSFMYLGLSFLNFQILNHICNVLIFRYTKSSTLNSNLTYSFDNFGIL